MESPGSSPIATPKAPAVRQQSAAGSGPDTSAVENGSGSASLEDDPQKHPSNWLLAGSSAPEEVKAALFSADAKALSGFRKDQAIALAQDDTFVSPTGKERHRLR